MSGRLFILEVLILMRQTTGGPLRAACATNSGHTRQPRRL